MSDSSDSPSPRPAAAAPFVIKSSLVHAGADEDACRPDGRPDDEQDTVFDVAAAAAAKQRKRRSEAASEDDGLPRYTVGEEIMNAVTHGVGCLLAIAGLVLLIVKAALGGGVPTHVASAIVYGVALILEYLASTLYHAIAPRRAKRVFRIIDHSCIYLLIAASYTPFLLIALIDDGGIPMFVLIWVLALAGVAFEVALRQRQPRWLTITIYLVMGWLVIFRLPQLVRLLDPVALALLAVGGVCYTIGTPFYCAKKIRYMHSVFHLWVLAGSIFQFMAVILFVI